jgi:hypothetical protein
MKKAFTATTHTPQSSGLTDLSPDSATKGKGKDKDKDKDTRKRPPRIVLVVACSQRKRVPPPRELQLGSIRSEPDERARQWAKRLGEVDAPHKPAEELYAGDHWHSVREAYALARRYSSRTELWVISAGYGLIPSTKPIKPYSATFASGASDSVWRGPVEGDRKECLRRWWQALRHDAALSDILGGEHDGAIVICAGAAYLAALEVELEGALKHDSTRDRISVISAGAQENGARLPVSGRLRAAVGGTDSALNARLLRFLTAEAPAHRFSRSAMAASLCGLNASLALATRPRRETTTDEEIAARIQQMRERAPRMSRTAGLRYLRSCGIACEQSRFALVWNRAPDVVSTESGS